MNKTYQTEFRRLFLLQELPEPLTRASEHLQIFDNYIENTRLRLRSARVPQTKEWTWILQQRFPLEESNLTIWRTAEIYLNEAEYNFFQPFEGREIRKNRYFYEFGERQIEIDVFLGELWGLNLAKGNFETEEELKIFEIPSFSIAEVTNNPFFTGENLVTKNFADVQNEFARMMNA
ncbi:MAG TPA: hypothetical protein VK892_05460 [Pyrinomonadaceae bacterium]|nr:hypothetical protein [Pyrinomonadaceae bacterium]